MLNKIQEPSSGLWEWCVAAVESLSFEAYDDFIENKFERWIDREISHELKNIYRQFQILFDKVKLAKAAYSLYTHISTSPPQIIVDLENIRKLSGEIKERLEKLGREAEYFKSDFYYVFLGLR